MTVTPTAPASADGLTPEQLDLQQRARRFIDEVCIPNEELAERIGGRLPQELIERIRREAIAAGLSGGLHAPEHGGQVW
jgi:alkylation response protein AidB-like acyl-CoA dehydrogenase